MKDALDPEKVFEAYSSYTKFRDAMQPCLEVNWDSSKTILTHVRTRVPPELARRRSPPQPPQKLIAPEMAAIMNSPETPQARPIADRTSSRLDELVRHERTGSPAHSLPRTVSPIIESPAPPPREALEAVLLGFYVRLMNSTPKAAQLRRQAADVSHLLEQIGDDHDAPESDMELRAQLQRELLVKREKYFMLLTKGEDLDSMRSRHSNGGGSHRGSFQTAGEIPSTDPRRTSNFLRRSSATPMRNPVNWSKVQSKTNTGRRDSSGGGGSRVNEYRRQTIHDTDVQRRQSLNHGEVHVTLEKNTKALQTVPSTAVQERRNSVAGQSVGGTGPVTRSRVRVVRHGADSNPDRFKSAAVRNREGAENMEPKSTSAATPSVSLRQKTFRNSFAAPGRSLGRRQ